MNFLRNTFSVLLGLSIVGVVISLGIRTNPNWITFDAFTPFDHWSRFLQSMQGNNGFFLFLLFISGVGTTIAGIVTAICVKYAKVAYALLVGFMMLFIAMLDVVIFPYHPTFYKISIFLVFFPFSWLGGKIVEMMYGRRKRN